MLYTKYYRLPFSLRFNGLFTNDKVQQFCVFNAILGAQYTHTSNRIPSPRGQKIAFFFTYFNVNDLSQILHCWCLSRNNARFSRGSHAGRLDSKWWCNLPAISRWSMIRRHVFNFWFIYMGSPSLNLTAMWFFVCYYLARPSVANIQRLQINLFGIIINLLKRIIYKYLATSKHTLS